MCDVLQDDVADVDLAQWVFLDPRFAEATLKILKKFADKKEFKASGKLYVPYGSVQRFQEAAPEAAVKVCFQLLSYMIV